MTLRMAAVGWVTVSLRMSTRSEGYSRMHTREHSASKQFQVDLDGKNEQARTSSVASL